MPIIKISAQDILRSKNLPEGYYKARVQSITLKQAAKGDSTNFVVGLEIEEDGRIVPHNFNTKAMGFALPFIRAILGTDAVKDPKDYEFDTDKFIGKKLQVHLIEEPYNGNLIQKVEDFLPYDKDTSLSF